MRPLRRAIVRTPSENLGEGLTTAALGLPDPARALEQHARYVEALRRAGLEVTVLPPDPSHPDATFVEDAAIATPKGAILCRPGAESRRGEVVAIRDALAPHLGTLGAIEPPATLDGGDVLEADGHVFIGITARTNEEGAARLAAILEAQGIDSTPVDLRGLPRLLHLKTGAAALGDGRLAAIDTLARHPAFRGWEIVKVPHEEAYAANLLRLDDHVVVADGFPKTAEALEALGLALLPVPLTEFRKMDGGASCLSIRY